jgi:hypothetical protein
MISKIKNYFSYILSIKEILFILENINIKKKFTKKKKGTILIQLTLDHWYLLFYKSLIISKYSDYNICGLWTHVIWPQKEEESFFFYITKLIVRKILYFKWLLLYRSIGVTKFINMGKINPNKKKIICNLTTKSLIKIKKNKDIFKIKYKNIKLGDLINDTYIRFKNYPTVNVNDPFLKKIIYIFFLSLVNLERINQNIKINSYICGFTSYINGGLATRFFINKRIETYTTGNRFKLIKKLNNQDNHHLGNSKIIRKYCYRNTFSKSEILDAKKEILKRFSGKKDIALSYLTTNNYLNNKKKINVNNLNKVISVLYLHDFYDAPHDWGSMIFSDYYLWTIHTLELIKKYKLPIAIKAHPNSCEESKVIEKKIMQKFKDIVWIDSDISNTLILKKKNIKSVVTANGSIAYEALFLGKAVICTGECSVSDFNFVIYPKSIEKYNFFLQNIRSVEQKTKIKIIRNLIYKTYFYIFMEDYGNRNLLAKKIGLDKIKKTNTNELLILSHFNKKINEYIK